jgi:hypothetical protein
MKNILLAIGLLLLFTTLQAQTPTTKTPWILRNSKITLGVGLSEPEKRYRYNIEIERYANKTLDWDISLAIEKNVLSYKKFSLTTGIGYIWANSNFNRTYDVAYMSEDKGIRAAGLILDIYTKHSIQAPLRLNLDLFRWNKKNAVFLNATVLPSICFYKWVDKYPYRDVERKNKSIGRFVLNLEEIEFNPGIGFRRGHFEYLLNYRVANFSKKDGFYFSNNYLVYEADFLNEPYEWHNPPKWWLTVAMCFGK